VTIRDFSGGWNVIDSELNLTTKYSPIMDNVLRGSDGSVAVRQGLRWTTSLAAPVSESLPANVDIFTDGVGDPVVRINWTLHGFSNGQHLFIENLLPGPSVTFGLTTADFIGKWFNVYVVDSDTITISVRNGAASIGSIIGSSIVYKRDSAPLGGEIINKAFFQGHFIVVSSIGEVVIVNEQTLVATQVWSHSISQGQAGSPVGWMDTNFASFEPYGGHLDIYNGIDSPLELDINNNPICQYLADPSTGSNVGIPQAAYGIALGGYSCVAGDTDTGNLLNIAALNTDSVFTGNPVPDDAVDVDMAKASNSESTIIIGLGQIRDKVVALFDDAAILGTLGIYKTVGSDQVHDPSFKDTIAQHGTVSHRSVVPLGNDLYMCDRVGVPSLTQSATSLTFVPVRVSDLIEPAIQQNISRLSRTTQLLKIFAVFNARERQYMLFMPKYDPEDVRALRSDPIVVPLGLPYKSLFFIQLINHGLEVGDTVRISGVATNVGGITPSEINGDRDVAFIIDRDTLVIRAASDFLLFGVQGGGTACFLQPTTDATIGYIYTNNPALRIKSWARFTGWKLQCGCKTTNGRVFFAQDREIYQLGSSDDAVTADFVGQYDHSSWAVNTSYTAGERVKDGTEIYRALVDHVSQPTGTFVEARAANPNLWEVFAGTPINFVWEWPWSDFDKRMHTKAMRFTHPDTTGTGEYTMQLYTDNNYKRSDYGKMTPVREITFRGGDAGGFGTPSPVYGGGRTTHDQYLWYTPLNAKILKFRFQGATTEPLRFIAVSIVYNEGSYQR